jgi:DeoR/GlpR family transcriptional regulator of sugar metabolism
MLSLERKNHILKLLDEKSAVTVGELAESLEVSEVSIRKILNGLARQGLLRRTRGGAVSMSVPARESDLRAKEKTNTRQKKAIAARAYDFVSDYSSLYLDAGTTTLELVRLIGNGSKRNLTVVSNAFNIAAGFMDSPDLEIILTGGGLRHGVGSCVGPIAEQAVASLCFDMAFIAANHVSLQNGATTPSLAEARIKRLSAERAAKKILLCDSSKFSGSASLACIAPLKFFDLVITDDGLSETLRSEMLKAKINLICA